MFSPADNGSRLGGGDAMQPTQKRSRFQFTLARLLVAGGRPCTYDVFQPGPGGMSRRIREIRAARPMGPGETYEVARSPEPAVKWRAMRDAGDSGGERHSAGTSFAAA